MAAKVDVISSTLVPKSTGSTSMSKLELTPWDLQLLLLDPIQKGILFHNPHLQKPINSTIDHLRNTFARALDFFPPLAGRLSAVLSDGGTTTLYSVDCNNAGAEFTHAAAATVSVSDVSEARYVPEIVSAFFPLNGVRNFEGVNNPLFGVQVTELADGLFIGCTGNHAVVDGTSFWHFINSWAELSRGLDKISKSPVFERYSRDGANYLANVALPTFDENALVRFVSPPLLERVFHFSKENVAKLKMKANAEVGSDRISSLQALLAHIWRSVTRCRCRQISNSSNNNLMSEEETYLTLAIGARARIPLPEGYFGNALHLILCGIREAELLQNGLGQAGLKINAFITQEGSKEKVLGFIEDWAKNPKVFRRGSSTFLVSSSPRYDVYMNDFGWGRPIAVRSGKGQKRDGKITVFPAAEPGGIDVEVCLVPETLRALDEDDEFMDAFIVSE